MLCSGNKNGFSRLARLKGHNAADFLRQAWQLISYLLVAEVDSECGSMPTLFAAASRKCFGNVEFGHWTRRNHPIFRRRRCSSFVVRVQDTKLAYTALGVV
jgi:hypothetical protein